METDDPVLCGVVEMDETYVGGDPRPRNTGDADSDDEDRGDGPIEPRPRGRGTSKPLLLTAVERGGSVHARRIESHRTDAIAPAWRAWVDPMAKLVTDALPAYCRIGHAHPSHLTVNHSRRVYARTYVDSGEHVHVNTAESYHAVGEGAWSWAGITGSVGNTSTAMPRKRRTGGITGRVTRLLCCR